MSEADEWLPGLVLLADCGGEWTQYLETVYRYFQQDFVDSKPSFKGQRCAVRWRPEIKGKHATFWHLISEGSSTSDRLPDLRRCERIRWVRPMIEAARSDRVQRWRNERQGDPRVVIALNDFSYVVVLAERGGYLLLLTAYCVEFEHRRQKLRKEHKAATKS